MNKTINMTNRGMITIPASIRKSHNLHDGQSIAIIDQKDRIILIPLIDFEKERENFLEMDEMKTILNSIDDEELKLEQL